MASEKKIIVTIGADGGTEIEAQGFPDGQCLKETKALEEALGTVTERTKKPEAFVAEKSGTKQKLGS